jgi:NADP-reducing hydrogenase subunit HndA
VIIEAVSFLAVDFFILLCDIPTFTFLIACPFYRNLPEGFCMTDENHPQHSDITNDMWKKIDEIITANHDVPGSVIGVLRECQDVVGYLPVELIDYISYGLNLSSSEVFGVASFYSLFSFEPKGRHLIKVCMGTACYVKGIQEAVNRIENKYNLKEGGTSEDRRFSLEAVRCLGACGLAPVVVVDQDTYGGVKAEKVIETLEKYE